MARRTGVRPGGKAMGRLQDKVAIITGGGGGIGRATVERFAEEGAAVVVAEIDEVSGAAAVAAVARSARATFLRLDAGDESSWRAVIAQTLEAYGALHILVNNAAQRTPLTIDETTLEAWQANQRVTSQGVFLGTKLGAEAMAAGGAIVNVASIAAFVGLPESFPYSAAKGSVRALSRSAAVHYARLKRGVRVNVVAPGSTRTAAVQQQLERLAAARGAANAASVLEEMLRGVPLGRMAEPREVADAILFLASDEASYITGAELLVDGGLTAA
jgi:NAD(P)-dependent dehydrogenase (short-subunit alcohol dehydrogenase family)